MVKFVRSEEERFFQEKCVESIEQVLQTRFKYSQDQTNAYIKKVTIDVSEIGYGGDDDVRTVECETSLPVVFPYATSTGDDESSSSESSSSEDHSSASANPIVVCFDYHHRNRAYETEHFVELKVRLSSGKKIRVFKNYMMDASRHFNYDEEPSIELRNFKLNKAGLTAIYKSLVTDEEKEKGKDGSAVKKRKGNDKGTASSVNNKPSLLDVLLLVYASCWVNYEKVINSMCENIALKTNWLEHHSRTLAGCPDPALDDDYETDDPQEQLEEHLKDWKEMRDDE